MKDRLIFLVFSIIITLIALAFYLYGIRGLVFSIGLLLVGIGIGAIYLSLTLGE